MQTMTPTKHEKGAWARLAQASYASQRADIGHIFSAAASLPHNATMPLAHFDALQSSYRAWLVFGEWKAVSDA